MPRSNVQHALKVLLRLLADILLYTTLGLLVYWYLTEDMTALWIAIGTGIVSAVLFVATTDIRQSHRRRQDSYGIWDWLYFIDVIELPFRLLWWLFSSVWRIFD